MLHTHALNKPLSGPNGYKRLARLVVRAFYSGECPPRTPEEVERDQQLAASGRSRAVKVCACVRGAPGSRAFGVGQQRTRSAAAPAISPASRVRLFTQRPCTAHAQPGRPAAPRRGQTRAQRSPLNTRTPAYPHTTTTHLHPPARPQHYYPGLGVLCCDLLASVDGYVDEEDVCKTLRLSQKHVRQALRYLEIQGLVASQDVKFKRARTGAGGGGAANGACATRHYNLLDGSCWLSGGRAHGRLAGAWHAWRLSFGTARPQPAGDEGRASTAFCAALHLQARRPKQMASARRTGRRRARAPRRRRGPRPAKAQQAQQEQQMRRTRCRCARRPG